MSISAKIVMSIFFTLSYCMWNRLCTCEKVKILLFEMADLFDKKENCISIYIILSHAYQNKITK